MEAIKNMNGSIWIFAILLVGMVVVQALLFLRLALNFNKKHNLLTAEETKLATRTGLITAIGPAVGVLPIVLSLIVLIGSGATFMRCGVIGAPVFELMIASLTSQIVGVPLGGDQFTEAVFTLCLFGMGLSVAGYFLNTAKGQVATIIGIVASVFMNLVLLLLFVLAGQALVTVLPEVVIDSFAFVTCGIFISLLVSRLNGKEGIVKGTVEAAPYLIMAVASRLVLDHVPAVEHWKISLVVVLCVILSYILYKKDCKKDEAAAK